MVQLLDHRVVLGDSRYRRIPTITGPQRDHSRPIIHDNLQIIAGLWNIKIHNQLWVIS